MNVPKFNADSGRPSGLPSLTTKSRQVSPDYSRRELLPFEADTSGAGEEFSNLREQFFKYLGLALKHRWLILGCCGAALAIGLAVTYTSTPIYQASVTIQIDQYAPKVVKVDTTDTPTDAGDDTRFYQTQYDLLKSGSLAQRVAANLDLVSGSFTSHSM